MKRVLPVCQDESRREFFAEDPSQGRVVLLLAFEYRQKPVGVLHSLQLALDRLAGRQRKIASRIFRASAHCGQRVAGVRQIQDRLRPARHGPRRHYQVDRYVE